MTEPVTDWGTLYDGASAALAPATEDEWRRSATSTDPIDSNIPTPPGLFTVARYVLGGPPMAVIVDDGWGILHRSDGLSLRAATEQEWQQSATSTSPIDGDTPAPPGVFLSSAGQIQYVLGGPLMGGK